MYKFTDKTSEVKNVEINMRQEANSLINEFGINVLYIRNCKYVRCSCFDDLNKTGDPNCKICMGSGYFASIQKTQAIESSNSAYSSENSITLSSSSFVKSLIMCFESANRTLSSKSSFVGSFA